MISLSKVKEAVMTIKATSSDSLVSDESREQVRRQGMQLLQILGIDDEQRTTSVKVQSSPELSVTATSQILLK